MRSSCICNVTMQFWSNSIVASNKLHYSIQTLITSNAPTKTKTQLEMQEPCDCDILTTHIACERYPFVLGFFFTVGKKVQGASGLLSSPLIKSGTLPKGIRATRSNK
jgi:hypothetical protein